MDKVHSLLVEYYKGAYPIDKIMKNMATSCADLLIRCQWLQEDVDCNKIFRLHKAWLGMCCMFNYNRRSVSSNGTVETYVPMYVNAPGPGQGLTIVVNDSFDVFAYKTHSTVSTQIAIFDPEVYPEMISTGFSESQAIQGREMQMIINPVIVRGEETMRKYDPAVRKCFFRDESQLSRGKFYSLSECIMQCRIEDVLNFCGCIPPHYTNVQNNSICLLNDIPCLAQWKERWDSWEPMNIDDDDIGKFARCPQCLPRCSYIDYKMASTWSFFKQPQNEKYFTYGIMKNLSGQNLTLIHFYFLNYYVNTMVQTVIYNWTEVLALLGGICGIMYGASLLSAVELIYFVTAKFFALLLKRNHHEESNDAPENTFNTEPELYWTEFRASKSKEKLQNTFQD